MPEDIEIIDMKPEMEDFRKAILEGLKSKKKKISSKFFYDKLGSALFDKITELPEYYPTRAEIEILQKYCRDIGREIGEDVHIVELGSGNGKKSTLLINCLIRPAEYIIVDVSQDALKIAARTLNKQNPDVSVIAICADYGLTDIMKVMKISGRKAIIFLGSTIGNMEPGEAMDFLSNCRKFLSEGDTLTVGVDLKKDIDVLEKAYNDMQGITAQFNLNLIHRISKEFDVDIPEDAFVHNAFYNRSKGRIEMHLESTRKQSFILAGNIIEFEKGETIHTENSYKYSVMEFVDLLNSAGFRDIARWEDSKVQYALFTAKV